MIWVQSFFIISSSNAPHFPLILLFITNHSLFPKTFLGILLSIPSEQASFWILYHILPRSEPSSPCSLLRPLWQTMLVLFLFFKGQAQLLTLVLFHMHTRTETHKYTLTHTHTNTYTWSLQPKTKRNGSIYTLLLCVPLGSVVLTLASEDRLPELPCLASASATLVSVLLSVRDLARIPSLQNNCTVKA